MRRTAQRSLRPRSPSPHTKQAPHSTHAYKSVMSRNGEYKSEGAWDEPRGDQSQGWGSPPSAAKTRPQAGSPPMPGRASTHSAEPRMSASPVTVKYENNHSRNASGHGSSASPKRPLPAHSERDDYAQTHSLMKSQRGEPAHGRRVSTDGSACLLLLALADLARRCPRGCSSFKASHPPCALAIWRTSLSAWDHLCASICLPLPAPTQQRE